jgi:succinyl-CoA synthetase beta subunit
MNIHEHQAKAVLSEFGVAVPRGFPAFSVEDAVKAAEQLGGPVYVVKSQIHAGGRGKGRFEGLGPDAKGGVRVVKSAEDVRANAQEMLGRVLVTHQTGPKGKQVNRLYIEEGAAIAKEFYLSLLVDRETSWVSVVASTEGGMDIETVAHDTPEKIITFGIDPATGVWPFHGRALSKALGLSGDLAKQAAKLLGQLYTAFVAKDMAMLEVNPLIVTADDQLRVLDAKVSFDSNALYRHPDVMALRDESEEDPKEIEASKFDLSYIALDGEIGCMVNGAGLAMATMDIIKLSGGQPANFLDVGGGANAEQIKNAFRILMSGTNVKAVLINIFGGILRCDVLAQGVIAAVRDLGVPVPIVIRMKGTNVEEGKRLLAESGLNFTTADTMGEAATSVVALAGGTQ